MSDAVRQHALEELEGQRLTSQVALDAERSAVERNVWGQFATPPGLANQIVRFALGLHERQTVDFLEPSVGSGAFFASLLAQLENKELASAVGVELDERFASLAETLWAHRGLQVHHADFTKDETVERASASLLIANPPYVRHHHLTAPHKRLLTARVKQELGLQVSGLAGLYVYFLLLSDAFLRAGAISAWLIPSEFMDVNYGSTLKQYLASNVTLRRIHRFDASDVQFDDALVTSAVVVFEKTAPRSGSLTEFTYGGSLESPRRRVLIEQAGLQPAVKWSRYFSDRHEEAAPAGPQLRHYLKVRRGIATGATSFFVLSRDEVDERGFQRANYKPILPSPRHVRVDVVESDEAGWPRVERQLALIDSPAPLRVLRETDPALAAYLDTAPPEVRSAYLVRQRDLWYRQEQRLPAPFLCTYMGRGVDEKQPFRFLLNLTEAVASNMFLMLYPTPLLTTYLEKDPSALRRVHEVLSSISGDDLRAGGRVYGGGLHKMEPKELAAMPADRILALAPELLGVPEPLLLPGSEK